jgi:glycosyltransferase involved in cell wall biosynthesis
MTDTAERGLPAGEHQVERRPIRVAHVAQLDEDAVSGRGRTVSGVDRTVSGLLTHLGAYGVESEFWNLSRASVSVSETTLGSVRNVSLPAYERSRSALFGPPGATRRFMDERRTKIDLLHLHSVFIPDNVWVAKRTGLPYVITPHGGYSPEVLRGRNRFLKIAWTWMHERSYVQGASLVHAVSPRELEQLRAMFKVDTLMFAPNAIELPTETVTAQQRMSLSPKRVSFLGRLAVDHKGLDVLLEGFARYVKSSGDADSELIIAGPDFRSGRAKLVALAASLLPDGCVRFPGPMFGEDKDSLLRSTRVFVHASRWEGMPYAVLEALATGCPVLLTPATNLGDLVEDYGAGVVSQGTAAGIHEGLARILDAPLDRYQAMSLAALRLASERFTWPKVAEQIAAAYRAILR